MDILNDSRESNAKHRAIFLDRDGVINALVYHVEFGIVDSPSRPDEFRILSGVGAAIRQINAMGLLAVVVSNQPGIAKGKFTKDLLRAVEEKMYRELAEDQARLDAVYYCLHHPNAVHHEYRQICDCRKPKPGLLLKAAEEYDIDLPASYFLGDGVTDILAGQSAGCKTFLLNNRKCYICDELAHQQATPDFIAKDLSDAIQAIGRLEHGERAALDQYRFRCQITCT